MPHIKIKKIYKSNNNINSKGHMLSGYYIFKEKDALNKYEEYGNTHIKKNTKSTNYIIVDTCLSKKN
jgi:hypothetical protein